MSPSRTTMDSSDISLSAVQDNETRAKDPGSSGTVKVGKNGASKETGNSILNSVHKSALQIKKPPRRKTSPLNWFPRKKTDSYLKRKIKLLQEVGGMNASLDETLGDSNPHYSRVEREKIAAREAARKAMEARKAAMVEASWCRILQAARIPTKEAESQLSKAEKNVAEAFEEAAAMGVIMYDGPDYPQQPWDVETSITGGGSTHTVTASFETAFEVDKEVAAAVKTAFIQLANCPNSSNKEEFRELLWKISQNPDASETNQEISESSECELETGSEFESVFNSADSSSSSDTVNRQMRPRKCKNRNLVMNNITKNSKLSAGLIDIMLDRLKRLQEEELASLATIVATCGLNAVLLEEESNKQHESVTNNCIVGHAVTSIRNMPPLGSSIRNSNTPFTDTWMKKKQTVPEVPSLDKLLVKHVSRLEKEVQEAINARKNNQAEGSRKTVEISDEHVSESHSDPIVGPSSVAVSDLGSILVRHTSRLEKEIEEAKKSQKAFNEHEMLRDVQPEDVDNESSKQSSGGVIKLSENTVRKQVDKENIDFNKPSAMKMTAQVGGMTRVPLKKQLSRIERAKLEALEAFSSCNEDNSLDKILVKSMHTLEREKMQAFASGKDYAISGDPKQRQGTQGTAVESLDKVLVKHMSRLQKEKMAAVHAKEDVVKAKNNKQPVTTDGSALESLDKVLVKHVSRLEKEKMAVHAKEDAAEVKDKWPVTTDGESLDKILIKHQSELEKAKRAASQHSEDRVKHSETRREARERELREAWGGLSLGSSIRPHLDQVGESLDKILIKHQSGLEKAKWAASQHSEDCVKHSETRREARERELQEAWGGLSLGSSITPHLSRLERDKAAWTRAEEEERRRMVELI